MFAAAFTFLTSKNGIPYVVIFGLLLVLGYYKIDNSSLESEVASLKLDIKTLEDKNKILTDNNDKLQASIDKQNKVIKENELDKEKLELAGIESKKLISNLQTSLNDMNKYNRQLQLEANEKRNELNKSLSENKELVNKINILNKSFKSSEDKIKYLTNVIVDYENMLNSVSKYNNEYLTDRSD